MRTLQPDHIEALRPAPPPPPQTKGTIVRKNEISVGKIWGICGTLLGPRPPPPFLILPSRRGPARTLHDPFAPPLPPPPLRAGPFSTGLMALWSTRLAIRQWNGF